eukprot:GHVT01105140.1.p3 GENE.GHVT01105140.1~~GHVT01105140.1.p3  ORF type:complete len:104 (+),score=2.74 GHVT01105140.1:2565-2876(+)
MPLLCHDLCSIQHLKRLTVRLSHLHQCMSLQYRKNDTNGETVRRVRLKDSKACHGMNLVDCRPPASAFDDVECTSENDIALQEKAMIPIVQTKRKLTRQRKNK